MDRDRINLWMVCFVSVYLLCLAVTESVTGAWQDSTIKPAPDAEAADEEPVVSFNFKNVAFTEVIDFFSRATGLPVIQEVDPPQGALTYFAPEPYSLSDGLRVLNIILQTKNVTLRRDGKFLYLGKLDQTHPGPTYVRGEVPGDVTDDQLITVLIPLNNVTANELSERLKGLVGAYGGLTPLPQQNSLLLTETAGQVRRMQTIIDALDTAGDYQDQVRIFPLQFAQAEAMMSTLKVLMSERVVKYVINQQGQQVKLEEDDLAGLRIEADKRTNTIIAKGPIARLEMLDSMIKMLDVTGSAVGGVGGAGNELTTVLLDQITPAEAAKLLETLYARLPQEQKPTVIPLEDVNKISVIGSALAIAQAVALIEEVDGPIDDGDATDESSPSSAHTTVIVDLVHAAPDAVQGAITALMSPRQHRMVKILPAPGGRGLILSGSMRDVDGVRDMIETLDLPAAEGGREVRMVKLNRSDMQTVVDQTDDLYAMQLGTRAAWDPRDDVQVRINERSRTLTLIGERQALDAWQKLLGTIEQAVAVERETRQFSPTYAKPSELVRSMTTFVRQLLTDGDSGSTAPVITGIDPLDLLIVTAEESQWSVIETLLAALDVDKAQPVQFRVVKVRAGDPRDLADQAMARYEDQYGGLFDAGDQGYGPVDVEVDRKSGSLLLTGQSASLDAYTGIVNQLEQLVPPQRTSQFIALRHRRAEDVLPELQTLFAQSDSIDAVRDVPDPTFVVMESTNGLLVTAEPAQHALIAQLIQMVDRSDEPITRSDVQVVYLAGVGDANDILQRTDDLYAKRFDTKSVAHRVTVERTGDDVGEPGVLTVIGTQAAIAEWEKTLRMVEATLPVDRETRQLAVEHVKPSEIIGELTTLTSQMLGDKSANRAGRPVEQPRMLAVDSLDLLLVTAQPAQWEVIERLLERLDQPRAQRREFRVVSLAGIGDITQLVGRCDERYTAQTKGLDELQYGPVDAEIDKATQSVLLTGTSGGINEYQRILNELKQLAPPARVTQFVAFNNVRADQVADRLRDLAAEAIGDNAASRPEYVVLDEGNGLLVKAEPEQQGIIAEMAKRLDVYEPTDLPPLRLLQLRTADAVQIAGLLQAQYGRRPAEERRARPVDVQADSATNTLIVSAHEDLYEDIRSFVDTLNHERMQTADRVTEIFPLKVARASDLATAMNELYPEPPVPLDRRGQPMPWLREPREVQISFDAASNALIVDAPSERIPAFQALVEKLDRMEVPQASSLKTYAVRGADINTVARTLQDLAKAGTLSAPSQAGQTRASVSITAEPVSGTLIVTGDETTFDKVEQLLAELQAVPVERQLRVLQVVNADPQEMADRAQAIYAEQTAGIDDAGPVDVQVDGNTGSLMIVADDEAMARFVGIVNQLQQSLGPGREVRLIPLEHARASEVAAFLTDLATSSRSFQTGRTGGGSVPQFEVIERTNSLLVSAQPLQHQLIQGLVRELDVLEDTELPPVRIVQVETADAANLATTLTQVYASRPAAERTVKPVSIRADAATNSLLVSAHPEPFAEIQEIVSELNSSRQKATTGREIRVFPLRVARAEELARTLDQMFPDPPIPLDRRGAPMYQLQQPREVVVRADVQTNSIIVDAPVERMAGFEDLVRQLDAAEIVSDAEVRTYPIEYADLNAVRDAVRQLVASGSLSATAARNGRGNVPITVNVEPVSRTLIVAGPVEVFAHIETVLKELDARPERTATVLRLFKLQHSRAEALVPLLRQVLEPRLAEEDGVTVPRGQRADGLSLLLEVTAENKTNTLIISAPESLMPIVEQLIEQLDDGAARLADPVIRIVPLTFAEAAAVVQTLTTALPQMMSPATHEPLDVRVIPSPASNALVMIGQAVDLDEAAKLVEPLDARPGLDTLSAQTFPLHHADAVDIRQIVEHLLTDQQEMDPRVRAYLLRSGRPALQTERPTIRVEADERTNSLIVSATQQTLALASTLIEQLDVAAPESDRVVRTFTPANVDAAKLIGTVSQMVNAGGGRSRVDLITENATGVVVAIGQSDKVVEAVALLEEFDRKAPATPDVDLFVLSVENVDPDVMAQTLDRILADRARWPKALREALRAGLPVAEPMVSADVETGRVLVSAPRSLAALAREVVTQFDKPRDRASAVEMRVFQLKRTNAEMLAPTLSQMLDKAPVAEMPVGGGRRGGGGGANRMANMRAPSRASVVAEPSTNCLIVSAPPSQLAEIEQLLVSLDQGTAVDQVQVRTVYLEHSRAEQVAPVVQQLLSGQQVDSWIMYDLWRRGATTRDPLDRSDEVRVAAEPRLNAVVISATGSMADVAEEMVRQLDVDPATNDPSSRRSVRVIALQNADAQQVATNLQAVVADEADTGDGTAGPVPVIRVDAQANSLIVRATDAQFRVIDEVIGQIESNAMAGSRQMRLIQLDRSKTDAKETAEALRRLLEQSGRPAVEVISFDELIKRQSQQESVRKEVESGSAAPAGRCGFWYEQVAGMSVLAIVQVPPANEQMRQSLGEDASHDVQFAPNFEWPSVSDVVWDFSGGARESVPTTTTVEALSPTLPDAWEEWVSEEGVALTPDPSPRGEEEVVDGSLSIADLRGERTGDTPVSGVQEERDDNGIVIAVDEASNSLIVFGSAYAAGRVEELARRIEQEMPEQPAHIRYVMLSETADPDQMANLISQAVTARRGQTTVVSGPVQVLADPDGPGLIVTANDTDFETVSSLIAALSRSGVDAEPLAVKVYSLTSVTADRARQSLNEFLQSVSVVGRRPRGGGRWPGTGRQVERMREYLLVQQGQDTGEGLKASIDPTAVAVAATPGNDGLIVTAPAGSLAVIDRFLELIDQSPMGDIAAIRQYQLQFADATQVMQTLQRVFQSQFQAVRQQVSRSGAMLVQAQFTADARTNSIMVTGTEEQFAEVDRLLAALDAPLSEQAAELTVIPLTTAVPTRVKSVIDQIVIGSDQGRKERVVVVPDDGSQLLLVRAGADDLAVIQGLVAELDRSEVVDRPLRTIKLERAEAERVATVLQKFFDDQAKVNQRPGQARARRLVSIVGDTRSSTLLVSAGDDDYAEVERIVAIMDAPSEAQDLKFEIVSLKHAKAEDLLSVVDSMGWDLTYDRYSWSSRSQPDNRGKLSIQADRRTNSLIVSGTGENFTLVENVIHALDVPITQQHARKVRVLEIKYGDTDLIARAVRDAFISQDMPWWWYDQPDPDELKVISDPRSKLLIVSGQDEDLGPVAAFVESLDTAARRPDQVVEVIALKYARANDVSRSLVQFFRDRARSARLPEPDLTLTPATEANKLVVSATEDQLAVIRDMLTHIDVPSEGDDRTVELYVLDYARSTDAMSTIAELFPSRSVPADQRVLVTADARTNSLIISAPTDRHAEIAGVLELVDAPAADEVKVIRTIALSNARADEVSELLTQTLGLDESGAGRIGRGRGAGGRSGLDETVTRFVIENETEPGLAVEVQASITPSLRNNSLIVVATPESMPLIEAMVAQLDQAPVVSAREFRTYDLEHAVASEVRSTLSTLMSMRVRTGGSAQDPAPSISYSTRENTLIVAATVDQHKEIEQILSQIDVPSQRQRTTEFVPLEFAQAEKVAEALDVFYGRYAFEADTPGKRNVSIVPDPATNSLVISAEEAEWPGIRELIAKLDAEEYDSSLQLRVIALEYADSSSVATAINQAFAPEVQGRRGRGGGGGGDTQPRRGGGGDGGVDENGQAEQPRILVEDTAVVRAAAEPLTNSIIVSASRQNLTKIEAIIEQLDVADFAMLPPVRLIPLAEAEAESVAESLRGMYAQISGVGGRPGAISRVAGRKSVLITSDKASNTVIVRAEDEEFEQIEALARALEETAGREGVAVRVLPLSQAAATHVAQAVERTFQTTAQHTGEPWSIQVDAGANSLVIASSARLFDQVKEVVEQLDALGPGGNRQIYVVPLENVAPEEMKRVLESLGLAKQARDGTPSLLAEPITITVLTGRRAIAVLANPADRDRILGIIGPLDAEPSLAQAEAELRIVPLRTAEASAVASVLREMLSPGRQDADTALARAVQEQIRRLRLRDGRDGGDEGHSVLDLTQPIRIMEAPGINALILSSTKANCDVLEELAGLLDALPVTDAVLVRLYPLTNVSAGMMQTVISDLFRQGRRLLIQPGTDIEGAPASETGHALLGDVAITVDERTNMLIAAGREESLALIDVLVDRLDADESARWVEPRIIRLRFADAQELAATIDEVLIRGVADSRSDTALQKQIGRLRVVQWPGEENGQQADIVESDLFVPMSRLLVRADAQLNSLIVVGTPENIDAVASLVSMLDVEAAAPSNAVRVYTLDHASAGRVATVVTQLFEKQFQSKVIRQEDRVAIQPDERTNSLIVTTSPRSFVIIESLLETLDAERLPDLREIRLIELKTASAALIAPQIQRLMDARLDRLRRVEPEAADLEQVTIIADARTNQLLVSAGNESYEVVAQLARALDESSESETNDVRVIPLNKANAAAVAEAIDQVMQRQYADLPRELAAREKPLILTDTRSNSLLVASNDEDLERIRQLVQILEGAPLNPAVGLHVVAVTGHNSAESLAPRLQRLMAERERTLGPGLTERDRTTIQADPASNSLIVAASDQNLEVLRQFMVTLEEAGRLAATDDVVEIVPLKNAQAERMVELLDQLYVREVNRTRGEGTVRITADQRINAVLISASATDVQEIRALIDELESAQVSDIREIEIVPLRGANSAELVSLLDNVLSGGRRRPSDLQSTIIRFIRGQAAEELEEETGQEPTETEISMAIREAIRLTPDLRTNSIIVSAPATSMRMIKEMINELDSAETGSKRVRIFTLVNADAIQMAEILSDLFNLRQEGRLYVLRPRDDSAEGGRFFGQDGGTAVPSVPSGMDQPVTATFGDTELITVPDERQQLSITVDPRTNSLLVSGTPRYLELVDEVVSELDQKTGANREELVHELRNARAEDVAEALTDFLTQEQERLLRTLGPERAGSIIQQLEREVSVVGVNESNTLLISASPRYVERIKAIIDELDRSPPQVLVSVMLAEVTLDSDEQWGVDWNSGIFEAHQTNFNASSSFGLVGAAISGLGVPNLSVSADDFDFLIRALEAQGRLEVLSRPQILVNNNQEAHFQVGQEVSLVSFVQVTDQGTTNSPVERQDIGVILDVLPSISPDGFVRMEVSPSITSLSARTTQISENFDAPIIDKRVVETVVTVKDGQTVVIGGLFSNRSEMRKQKVPFFGDIPFIGPAFRTNLHRREKTELLVVITPHVVASMEDAMEYTDEAIIDMTLPASTKDQLRRGRIESSPTFFGNNGWGIEDQPNEPWQPAASSDATPAGERDSVIEEK